MFIRDGYSSPLKTVTIGRGNNVNAHGKSFFTVTIPKKKFTDGLFTLYAAHTPNRGASDKSLISSYLVISYDSKAPAVEIENPDTNPARQKVISAADSDSDSTEWMYKQIASEVDCAADTMHSGAKDYTEGEELTFTTEEDNGTKVCFSVVDAVGNTDYEVSSVIRGIDTTVSEVTVNIGTLEDTANAQGVRADDGEDSATVWMYKQIEGSAVCGEGAMQSDTSPYEESSVLVFARETDNGTKICFSSEDTLGDISYGESPVLRGIDTTAPSITVTGPVSGAEPRTKEVSATDTDAEGVTYWAYAKIAADEDCSLETVDRSAIISYTEGSPVIIGDTVSDTRVCFVSVDPAGNIAQDSVVVESIDAVSPTITIKVANSDVERDEEEIIEREPAEPTRMKVISATDGDAGMTDWMYRQIDADSTCDASVMMSDASEYDEGEKLVFTSERDNDTKVCFSASDVDGNTAHTASEVIRGIDAVAPTVASAALTSRDRTVTEVRLTEPVYVAGLVSPRDFTLVIDGVSYAVTRVSGLTQIDPQVSFTLTHPPISGAVTAAFRVYAGDTSHH